MLPKQPRSWGGIGGLPTEEDFTQILLHLNFDHIQYLVPVVEILSIYNILCRSAPSKKIKIFCRLVEKSELRDCTQG